MIAKLKIWIKQFRWWAAFIYSLLLNAFLDATPGWRLIIAFIFFLWLFKNFKQMILDLREWVNASQPSA